MGNFVEAMGDNSGASNSTRDPSDASSSEAAGTGTAFYRWKYRHYYIFLSEDAKNFKVRCTLCAGNKMLLSAKNTTSNLKKHLTSIHKNTTLIAKEV